MTHTQEYRELDWILQEYVEDLEVSISIILTVIDCVGLKYCFILNLGNVEEKPRRKKFAIRLS